jgi:hypothetical protein
MKLTARIWTEIVVSFVRAIVCLDAMMRMIIGIMVHDWGAAAWWCVVALAVCPAWDD